MATCVHGGLGRRAKLSGFPQVAIIDPADRNNPVGHEDPIFHVSEGCMDDGGLCRGVGSCPMLEQTCHLDPRWEKILTKL